jgi:ankyrin repeat protein
MKSPLYAAASLSDDHILKLFLARTDLNVRAADSSGFTPIFEAVYRGRVEAVVLLLDHANSDMSMLWNPVRHESLLMYAAKKGYTSIVQVLLDRQIFP